MELRIPRYYKSYIRGSFSDKLLNMTIGVRLKEITQKHGDNKALICQHQNKQFNYQQLLKESEALASSLLNLKLQKFDRVGIYSPNNYQWTLTQYACSLADLILVNINPAYQKEELKQCLNQVEVSVLITSESHKQSNYIQMLNDILPELKAGKTSNNIVPSLKFLINIDEEQQRHPGFIPFSEFIQSGSNYSLNKLHNLKIDVNSPTNIQFTSGTTGLPKAATLSHHNILNNGYFVGQRMNLTPIDKIVLSVPLYHCFGMVLGNLAALNYASTIVQPSYSFKAAHTLQAITQYQCTAIYGVPTMFIDYLQEYKQNKHLYNISSLRTGIIAGSLASEWLMQEIIETLNVKEITNCYGMTETSPVSFQSKHNDPLDKRVSKVGQILPHLEAKIVNENEEVVEIGQPGEFRLRGYSTMNGYWNDPNNTKTAFDSQGWIKSGDLAIIDHQGYLSIIGRIKDIIIRGGENVYPKEIEDYIHKIQAVKSVQVVGCYDHKMGEEIAVFIQLHQGATLNKQDVYNHCYQSIAHYKIPKYVFFVDSFPMTLSGKIQKFKLQEIVNSKIQDSNIKNQYQIR